MRLACRYSEQWLRQTFHAWLGPSVRHVSTSSAIKRGLRATKTLGYNAARAKEEGKSPPAHVRFGSAKERGTYERGAQNYADRDQRRGARRPLTRRHEFLDLSETASTSKGQDRRARARNPQPQYHTRGSAVQGRGNASKTSRPQAEVQPANHQNDTSSPSTVKLMVALADQMASIRHYEELMSETPAAELDRAQRLVNWVNEDLQKESLVATQLRSLLRSKMGGQRGLWSTAPFGESSTYTQLRVVILAKHRAGLRLYVPSPNALSLQKQTSKSALRDTLEEPQGTEREQDQSRNGESPNEFMDPDEEDGVPVFVPYTTAASVFIYGSNTVLAALRAQRRKMYNLYLHPRLSSREDNATAITKLAKQLNIRVTNQPSLAFLDKASEGRPHNGVVLEASRFPAPPLLSLAKPDRRTSIIPLVLDRQSAEDVLVNGAPGGIATLTQTWRQPFVLMLDGIVDPGNVGNILRTAHFYGVDAVAVATNTCASLALATLAKASSGACEAVRIFALPKPADFVRDSVRAEWQAYAAVAALSDRPKELWTRNEADKNTTTNEIARSSPLAKYPTILMLGAEGEGLRENLRNKATRFVTIEQRARASDEDQVGKTSREDVGVDSLNVGVAAGVLVDAFMRRPEGAGNVDTFGELGF